MKWKPVENNPTEAAVDNRMSHLLACLVLVPVMADAGRSPQGSPSGTRPPAYVGMPSATRASPHSSPPPWITREQEPPPSGTVRLTSATSAVPVSVSQDARRLPPPSNPADRKQSLGRVPTAGSAFSTVAGSLVVVVGAFLLVAWITQRAAPRRMAPLPSEVVECLGRAPLTGRQQIQLLRLGKKLVLVAVTATEARTLSEVTDPLEVDRLSGLCQQIRPESITASFRQVLAQCSAEPVPRVSVASHQVAADRATGIDQRAGSRERARMSHTGNGWGERSLWFLLASRRTGLYALAWWAMIVGVPPATAWGQPPSTSARRGRISVCRCRQAAGETVSSLAKEPDPSPFGSRAAATVPIPADVRPLPPCPHS